MSHTWAKCFDLNAEMVMINIVSNHFSCENEKQVIYVDKYYVALFYSKRRFVNQTLEFKTGS